MPYKIACRSGRLSVFALSWPSRFCQEAELTRLIPGAPRSDSHSAGAICSTKLTCPDRSSCTAVVSCGTTRNTTLVKCEPVQPPQYPGNWASVTSNSWPLFQVCTVYGPVPASCGVLSHLARLPLPAALVS